MCFIVLCNVVVFVSRFQTVQLDDWTANFPINTSNVHMWNCHIKSLDCENTKKIVLYLRTFSDFASSRPRIKLATHNLWGLLVSTYVIQHPTASLLGWLSLSDSFSQWPSILCIHRCRWFTFSEWPSILCIHRCRWFTFSEWPSILCIHRCRLWLKVTYFLYWQLPPVETNI